MKEIEQQDYEELEESSKSDMLSPLFFFFIKESHLKFLVPDFECYKCKELFLEAPCHESSFGLGRLAAYEGKFHKAVEYLEKALAVKKDLLYQMWKGVLKVKTAKNFESEQVAPLSFFQRLMCCSAVRRKSGVISELEEIPENIESLWCFLELSLKGLIDVEPPQFYATQMKAINEYYAYLAWGEILTRRNDIAGFVDILKGLIYKFGNKPEAYCILWKHYYYVLKDFELAEDILAEALLKVNSQVFFHYYILFCIYTAKTYFKLGKYKECIGYLKKKFLEHPTYPVFLYEFGHLSAKSGEFNLNGAAIGALQESIRLCDSSRYHSIYYWLTKAFILARLHIDAYTTGNIALTYLQVTHSKKLSEIKACISEIQPNILKIEEIESFINSEAKTSGFARYKEMCKELKAFNKLTYDILYAKLLWRSGDCERSLKKLYAISGISTVKMTGYFILLDYLKHQKNLKCMRTVSYEMLVKCRNPQVPSTIWMEVNVIYAKMLIESRKPGKAILMLKSIAKILPPFPFIDIPYTKLLQRAKTIQDLTEAHSKVIQSYNAYNFGNYKNSFIDTETNPREFSKKLIEEDDAPGPNLSPNKFDKRRTNRLATEKFDSRVFQQKKVFLEDVRDEKDKNNLILEFKSRDNSDGSQFTVCSDPIFLYKIGKIAMRFNICLQDGICAIKDYLELLKYEKDKDLQDLQKNKAVKLLSMLLEQKKS